MMTNAELIKANMDRIVQEAYSAREASMYDSYPYAVCVIAPEDGEHVEDESIVSCNRCGVETVFQEVGWDLAVGTQAANQERLDTKQETYVICIGVDSWIICHLKIKLGEIDDEQSQLDRAY